MESINYRENEGISNTIGGLLVLAIVVILVVLVFPAFNSIIGGGPVDNAGSSSSLVTAIEETPSGIEVKTIQAGQGGEILVNGNAIENIPAHSSGKTYNIKNVSKGDTVSVKPNQTDKIQQKHQVENNTSDGSSGGSSDSQSEKDNPLIEIDTYDEWSTNNPLIEIDTYDEWSTNNPSTWIKSRNAMTTEKEGTGFFSMDKDYMTYSVYASKNISIPNATTRNDSEITTVRFEWQNLSKSQEIRAGVYVKGGKEGRLIGDSNDKPFIIDGSNSNSTGSVEFTTNQTEFDVKKAKLVAVIKSDGLMKSPKLDRFAAYHNSSMVSENDTVATPPFYVTLADLDTVSEFNNIKDYTYQGSITTKDGGNGRFAANKSKNIGAYISYDINITDKFGQKITPYNVTSNYTWNKSSDYSAVIVSVDNQSQYRPGVYKNVSRHEFRDSSEQGTLPADDNVSIPSSHMRVTITSGGNFTTAKFTHSDTKHAKITGVTDDIYQSTNRTLPRIARILQTEKFTVDTVAEWKEGNHHPGVYNPRKVTVNGRSSNSLVYEKSFKTPSLSQIGGSYEAYKQPVAEWESLERLSNGDFVAYNAQKPDKRWAEYIYSNGTVRWNQTVTDGSTTGFNIRTSDNQMFVTYRNSTGFYVKKYWMNGTSEKVVNLGKGLHNILNITDDLVYFSHDTRASGKTSIVKFDFVKETEVWNETPWVNTTDFDAEANLVNNSVFYAGEDTSDYLVVGRINDTTGDETWLDSSYKAGTSFNLAEKPFNDGWVSIHHGNMYLNTGSEKVKKFSDIYNSTGYVTREWSKTYSISVDAKFDKSNVFIHNSKSGDKLLERVNDTTGDTVWTRTNRSHNTKVGTDNVYTSDVDTMVINKTNGEIEEEYKRQSTSFLENASASEVYGYIYYRSGEYRGRFDLDKPQDSLNVSHLAGDNIYTFNTTEVKDWNITNLSITLTDDNVHVWDNNYESIGFLLLSNETKSSLINIHSVYGGWAIKDNWATVLPNNYESYKEEKYTFNATTDGCAGTLCIQEDELKKHTQVRLQIRNNKLDEEIGVDSVSLTGKSVIIR